MAITFYWGSGRERSMCCSVKNACSSTASFAAIFNTSTGLLLPPPHYYITVVLSKSCASGKNSRDMPLILGCPESFSLVVEGVGGLRGTA